MTRDLAGWRHVYSGKVRDLYVPDGAVSFAAGAEGTTSTGGPDVVLVVASDRVSAFDHVLEPAVPHKGEVLTALSLWWFEQLADLVPNHVVTANSRPTTAVGLDGLDQPSVPAEVAGRAIVCKRLEMFPVECVVRGYLTGSGLAEYRESGSVTGIDLPPGLVDGSRLPEPIFTPATKAAVGEHDENVPFSAVIELLGTVTAELLRSLSLAIYSRAEEIARARGIILADTKFEFGIDPATGEIVLGDEVLTPDSSRFWDAAAWKPGRSQPSFDKQDLRDWLASPASGWDKSGDAPPPRLPDDVVVRTSERYREAYERLTGTPFTPAI